MSQLKDMCGSFFKCGGLRGCMTSVRRGLETDASKMLLNLAQIATSVMLIIYLYNEDWSDSVPNTDYFGVNVLTARNFLLLVAVLIGFIGLGKSVSYLLNNSKMALVQMYKTSFDDYMDSSLHTTLSLAIVAIFFVYTDAEARQSAEIEGKFTLLWVSVAIIYAMKLVFDIVHGQDGLVAQVQGPVNLSGGPLGEAEQGKVYKHARGPAVVISTGILLYLFENGSLDLETYEIAGAQGGTIFLVILFLGLALFEKFFGADKVEELKGEILDGTIANSGVSWSGLCMYVLLAFSGWYLSALKSKESLVVAIAVLYLDAMNIGAFTRYTDKIKAGGYGTLYRILQLAFGIITFSLLSVNGVQPTDMNNFTKAVLQNTTDDLQAMHVRQEAVTDVLYGVGLAASLIKVTTVLYIKKDFFEPSTESTFRRFSTLALLVTSSYLWGGAAAFSELLKEDFNQGYAVAFFVIAIFIRTFDSVLASLHIQGAGKEDYEQASFAGYVLGFFDPYSERGRVGMNSPTGDNIRSWFVVLSLATSLGFLSRFRSQEWHSMEDEELHSFNRVLTDYSGLALGLTITHLIVAVLALLPKDGMVSRLRSFAISRSHAIRLAVSTTVICCLVVVAGQTDIAGAAHLSAPDSANNNIIGALVAYLFADALGAELL